MKLLNTLLNEEPQPKQKTVSLEELTFDLLLSMFGKTPAFGFQLPLPEDATLSVFNEAGLEEYKNAVKKKYGNVNLRIDTEAAYSFEKIKILDDKFIADKKARTDSKAADIDAVRKAGGSTD